MHNNNNNNNNNNDNLLIIRKRKRTNSTLKVHFCTKPIEVIDTYSPLEYDRSGLFDKYNQEEFPFNEYHHEQQKQQKENIILTLSINFIPTTTTKSSPIKQKKKPKLSIDTSNIHGPLYFTNMSTNHQKKDQVINKLDDDNITLKNTEFNRSCLLLMA